MKLADFLIRAAAAILAYSGELAATGSGLCLKGRIDVRKPVTLRDPRTGQLRQYTARLRITLEP